MIQASEPKDLEGILLVDKPSGYTSFSLIRALRKITGIKKIGHAGTLDPFAQGVMVLLIGRSYTALSNQFLVQHKEYEAKVHLGIMTDTYDCDGKVVARSKKKPNLDQVNEALDRFQNEIEQVPPMHSAKKVAGKKLYELAREGKEIPRKSSKIFVKTTLISYEYPYIRLRIFCSKGTYIRSIAHEIGLILGCGAHVVELTRTKSGVFELDQCINGTLLLENQPCDIKSFLIKDTTTLLKTEESKSVV